MACRLESRSGGKVAMPKRDLRVFGLGSPFAWPALRRADDHVARELVAAGGNRIVLNTYKPDARPAVPTMARMR
jgi:hypothetical protein